MNELQVKGNTNFMGVELPNIIGGFGEDKKAITDKHISEIHNVKTIHIRELLNRNINRFKKNIDYMDLKNTIVQNDSKELLKQIGYSDVAIRNAKNIFLLSERGYAKLIKIMDTDLAWEIHDRLIDEYFQMKEVIQKNKQLVNDKKIDNLIDTVNNLATTVNNLILYTMNNTQNSQNKTESETVKIVHKDKLDVIEEEIMNFTEETMRIQNFCDFINDKDIVPKRIGVQLVNQLLRDNGIYNKYNTPTDENNSYFIKQNTRNLLTKQGMLMLYKLIKDNVNYRYIVRR